MKNWILENKILAGILAFMMAGVLGLGAWLYFSYDSYSTVREEYNKLGEQVTGLESNKLYPSASNVDSKAAKVKNYEDQVDKLRKVLLISQQDVKPITETDFQAKLKELSNDITLRAKRAQMKLPESFALGFDDYTGSLPKSPEMAAELSLHLDVMDKLVGTLVESGISKLESVERTKLSSERGAVVVPIKKTTAKPAKGAPAVSAAPVEPVLDRYPIKLVFDCDQAPLQNVLNTFANPNPKIMPYFTVVRLVRIDNEKQDAPTKDEVKSKLTSGSNAPEEAPAAPGAPAGARIIKPVTPLPADAATIMGDELLHVYLEVDYIRFHDAAKKAEGAQPGK